jgi:hypothetical protein
MTTDQRLEQAVRKYFALSAARDPRIGELIADDIEFCFPRFGVGRGKDQLAAFSAGFRSVIQTSSTRRPSSASPLPACASPSRE